MVVSEMGFGCGLDFFYYRDRWLVLVNTVINFRIS